MRAKTTIAVIAVVLLASGFIAAAAGEHKTAPAGGSPTASSATAGTQQVQGSVVKEHIIVKGTDAKWGEPPPVLPRGAHFAVVEGDPKAPGQLVTFRLKMPDGYRIPPHFHPADEHVVVLQGTFNMGMGDKLDQNASTALEAGSFVVMPKGQHHFAWAKGETIVQVYAIGPWGLTYVNPKDDPRNGKM